MQKKRVHRNPFWEYLFGFPLRGILGGRYRALGRFRVAWRGSEGDRTKLGVRGLGRALRSLGMGGIGVSRRAPSDAVLKVGGRRAKYGWLTRQILARLARLLRHASRRVAARGRGVRSSLSRRITRDYTNYTKVDASFNSSADFL